MEINGDLKSREITKKRKKVAEEPHLTVNQRLFFDNVIELIEDFIPIDPKDVRMIISASIKKWELENKLHFSDLEKISKDEFKTIMDEIFIYFEQITVKKFNGKIQNQVIKKSLDKASEQYFKKYHPAMSNKKLILYVCVILVSVILANLLVLYISSRLDIFPYTDFPSFPVFP